MTTPTRPRLVAVAIVLAAAAIFVFDPWGFDRWVFAKELVFVVAAGLAWFTPAMGRLPSWLWWWLLAAASVLVIGALTSAAPLAQLIGRWPRYEGLVSLAVYVLALAVGARLLGGNTEETAKRGNLFYTVLAAALSITAVIAALEVMGIRPIASVLSRPGSLLGNASDLGVVGVVSLALFVPRAASLIADRASGRLIAVTGLVAAIAIVVLSASRGAFLGAIVAFVVTAIIAAARKERRATWWATLATAAVAAVVTTIAIPATAGRLTGASPHATSTAMNRLDLWADTLALFGSSPLTGVGASGFADAIPPFLGEDWFSRTGIGGWIESPHNVALQVLAAGGILGLVLVVGLLVVAIRHLQKQGLRGPFGVAGIVALAAAGVALLTHFTAPGPMLLLCLIAGATFSVAPREPATPLRVAGAAGIGAWVIVLVLAVSADHQLQQGITAIGDGDAEAADGAFQTAAQLRPWDADLPLIVSEQLAAVAELAGSTEPVPTAGEWASDAVGRLPDSTRALKAQAVIAQFSGDFVLGISALERAAELSPNDPQVFHRLGGLYLLSGQLAPALTALERAAVLAPDNADVLATLEYARSLG